MTTKFFRLQPEYMGTRRIRVTVCNAPANLTGDVMASFLRSNGKVQDVTQLCAATGTAHRDYVLYICLNQEGFQSIADTIYSRDRQIMVVVVVEGRRPHCWNCKQLGNLAKACPQKAPKEKQQNTTEDIISTTKEKDKYQLDPENQWTQVHKKKKIPTKTINETTPKDTSSDTTTITTRETAIQTYKAPKNKNTAPASSTKITPEQTEETMETTVNVKRSE